MGAQGDPLFLDRVWGRARTVWDPESGPDGALVRHSAISALVEEFGASGPTPFVGSDPTKPDFFASEYCFDSYLLENEQRVSERFGERAVSRTWWLTSGTSSHEPGYPYPVEGLACRYFRFATKEAKPMKLTVTVTAQPGHKLRAEMALVTRKSGRKGSSKLTVKGQRSSAIVETDRMMRCELAGFSSRIDHAVLIVTNCSLGDRGENGEPLGAYNKQTQFWIEASCG